VFLSDDDDQLDESSKALQKMFYKKTVSKSFYKKIDKKIQNRLFSIIFYQVFGRFSVRGVQKHHKKSQKKLTSPGTFSAPEEPTNHVKARHFVFEGPLWRRRRHWRWHWRVSVL
jgi:hypothetical protein